MTGFIDSLVERVTTLYSSLLHKQQCPQSRLRYCYLVAASNGGRSPSSGFPNGPRSQPPASRSWTPAVLWLTHCSPTNSTHCISQSQTQSQSQSQSFFMTGVLPLISSSWRQAPWGSRSEIFLRLNPQGHSPYVTSYLTRGWVDNLE
jgi:hypothetical protein